MKKVIATVLFCFVLFSSFAQSQTQMNEDADKAYQKADKELNSVYGKILTEYKKDVTFIANLKAAQRLWVRFRDAEVKARYPARKEGEYGSSLPMCISQYMTELTEERTQKLSLWLKGIEEGDVCSGSVKIKS